MLAFFAYRNFWNLFRRHIYIGLFQYGDSKSITGLINSDGGKKNDEQCYHKNMKNSVSIDEARNKGGRNFLR